MTARKHPRVMICTVCRRYPPRMGNGNVCSNECAYLRDLYPGDIAGAQAEYKRQLKQSKHMDKFIYGK